MRCYWQIDAQKKRSYRLIILKDSLAVAAYYKLKKLLEVKGKKKFPYSA